MRYLPLGQSIDFAERMSVDELRHYTRRALEIAGKTGGRLGSMHARWLLDEVEAEVKGRDTFTVFPPGTTLDEIAKKLGTTVKRRF